jgi:hypothetical protein
MDDLLPQQQHPGQVQKTAMGEMAREHRKLASMNEILEKMCVVRSSTGESEVNITSQWRTCRKHIVENLSGRRRQWNVTVWIHPKECGCLRRAASERQLHQVGILRLLMRRGG